MKTHIKISFLATVVIIMVSFTSCSVEYRTRHPRPVREHIIVVGMVKPAIPADTAVTELHQQTPVNKAYIITGKKAK